MSRALLLATLVLAAGLASAQSPHQSATLVEEKSSAMPPRTATGPLAIDPVFYADGRLVAFEGMPTPFHVVIQNPLSERVNGTIQLAPIGDASLNETTLDFEMGPGEYQAWSVLLIARGGSVGMTAQTDAIPGASARIDLEVAAPLSVLVSSPASSHVMGGKERVEFRANVTNHGTTPRSDSLVVFLRDQQAAELALDPPVAPGETREISWGEVQPEIPPMQHEGRPFSFPAPWSIALHADGAFASAFTMRVDDNGTLLFARLARGDMHVVVGASLRLELDHAAPGERSVVVARVRNDGDAPLDATLRLYPRSSALRLNPEWRLEPFEKRILLDPGETGEYPYVFTPRVAASLQIEGSLSNSSFHMSDSLRVEMDSLVELIPVDEPWTKRTNLSDSALWRLRLTAREDIDRARLHVAVAPRHGESYDGLVAQRDLLGLEISSSETLDGMGAGDEREITVRYTGRASGSFVVVPYVEIGGVAYLGALPSDYFERMDGASASRMNDAAYEATELRSLILVANVMPTPLASMAPVAPAALLFLGVVGLYMGRRWLVR